MCNKNKMYRWLFGASVLLSLSLGTYCTSPGVDEPTPEFPEHAREWLNPEASGIQDLTDENLAEHSVLSDGVTDAGEHYTTPEQPQQEVLTENVSSNLWRLSILPEQKKGQVSPFLLGHYDLSGDMFQYHKKANLIDRMKQVGFREWRISTGRWEVGTWLFPTLTDGQSCASALQGFPLEALVPAGKSDIDLMQERDWFTYTDGQSVTTAMTKDPQRYQLTYLRRQLDIVEAFGAQAFVSLDHMPRALAANTKPVRQTGLLYQDPCWKTFTNAISNSRPADPAVYAAAVVGLVRQIVEGSNLQPARNVPYWEFGNEPEFPEFWDRSYLLAQGAKGEDLQKKAMDSFFQSAFATLLALHDYRTQSINPQTRQLRLGLGSFALTSTAVAVLKTLDQNLLPSGKPIPVDFLSFHAYSNDPLLLLQQIEQVVAARSASRHLQNIELVLAEWGPELNGQGWNDTNMDLPLLVGSVLTWSAYLGIQRAHHSIFWDFYSQNRIRFGLLDHAGQPKALWYAYQLLHETIGSGRVLLALQGVLNGKLEEGLGATLVTQDEQGMVRILLVHRGSQPRVVEFQWAGKPIQPKSILLFDQPQVAPRSIPVSSSLTLPPRSIALFLLSPPS